MRHNALNGKIVPKLYRNQAYDKQTFEKTMGRNQRIQGILLKNSELK